MDDIDRELVLRLQEDGRVSWVQLADALGVTPPAIAQRVRRLEGRGILRGFTAVVDAESIGLGLTAFVATSIERPTQREAFLERIAALGEVQECHHLTGEDDYLLKVRCRGVRDLDRLINVEIKGIPGVLRTRTMVVLRTSKESTALPLPSAADEVPAEAQRDPA
jgi:Lrp/AsnC family leucine-responsive transcriptional regulator